MTSRTMAETAARLPSPRMERLPAPAYSGGAWDARPRVGLAVESMARHTSREGWELFLALQHAGYVLHGHAIGDSLTDVEQIVRRENPGVVVAQDVREHMGLTADRSRDPRIRFRNLDALRGRNDVLKLTVVKDAQHDPALHRSSAEEMGCHGFVHYYHPDVVCRLAPYVRREHLVRTWHTIDPAIVPPYSPEGRRGCLISGAVSAAYPLRQTLINRRRLLPSTDVLPHPGYRADRCFTPDYLETLSLYKVSIATSSVYGYALKKLIEATACGCRVVTDLPADDVLPEIDGNLTRVHPSVEPRQVGRLVERLLDSYDPEKQREYAGQACAYYDFRQEGLRLAEKIEQLRRNYP